MRDLRSIEAWTGHVIDHRYRLDALIEVDSKGAWFQAQHLELNSPVAIRMLSVDTAESARRRDVEEARVFHRLRHPALVRVLDIVEGPPTFIVTEWLGARTLRSTMAATGPCPWETAVSIIREVLVGLREALEHGVRPGVLTLDALVWARRPDGSERIKVLTLTLGRSSATPAVAPSLLATQAGGDEVAPAPEEALGTESETVSSVAAILYELVTGMPPFAPGSTNLLRPRAIQPALPEVADAILHRALASPPGRGFSDATALLEALGPDGASPSAMPVASPPSAPTPGATTDARPPPLTWAPLPAHPPILATQADPRSPGAHTWAPGSAHAPILDAEDNARPPALLTSGPHPGVIVGLTVLLGLFLGWGIWWLQVRAPNRELPRLATAIRVPTSLYHPPAISPRIAPPAAAFPVEDPEPVASTARPPGTPRAPRSTAQVADVSPPSMPAVRRLERSPTAQEMRAALERARAAVERCLSPYRGDLDVSATFLPEGTLKANIGQGPSRDARYCAQAEIHHLSGIAFSGPRTEIRYTFRGLNGNAPAAAVPSDAQLHSVLERIRPFVLQCVGSYRGGLDVSVNFAGDGAVSSRIGQGPSRDARYCVQREINARASLVFHGSKRSVRYRYQL